MGDAPAEDAPQSLMANTAPTPKAVALVLVPAGAPGELRLVATKEEVIPAYPY